MSCVNFHPDRIYIHSRRCKTGYVDVWNGKIYHDMEIRIQPPALLEKSEVARRGSRICNDKVADRLYFTPGLLFFFFASAEEITWFFSRWINSVVAICW